MASTIDIQLPVGGSLPETDMIEGRKWLAMFEKQGNEALGQLHSALEEFYMDIPTSDGWQSRCKVIRPKLTNTENKQEGKEQQKQPLIVYFYGGGYGMGSIEQITRPAREWAENHNATVVCPSYRLTPENIWPKGVKDGWDVVSYLARHAEGDARLGNINLSHGFIVGGVSAGAGVAGVIGGIAVLLESESSNPEDGESKNLTPPAEKLATPLTGLFLAVPLFAHEDMIPPAYQHLYKSWEENAHDPNMNTANVMRSFTLLKCSDYKSPWFSPINVLERALPLPNTKHIQFFEKEGRQEISPIAKSRIKITKHPSVYIQACAHDPIRDDALVYHRLLKDVDCDIRTKLDVFPDDGHAAWTALPAETESKNPTMKEATLEGMRWLLGTQKDVGVVAST